MAVRFSTNQLTAWLFSVIVSISQAQQNNVNGSVGRSALLPCSFKFISDQYANFSWLKNNSLLINGTIGNSEVKVQDETYQNRVQLPENSSFVNLSLLITDLKLKDFGIYRCEAYSKNRSVRSEETFLTITRDAVSKPIVRILQGQNITDENRVVLKCEVTSGSLPINYMWHRKASKTEKAKKIRHYQQTLELNPTMKEGRGFFFCKVSNNFSTEKSSLMKIPVSDSATSSVETTLNMPNNTSIPRIPWLVVVITSAMVLFIVSIILATIRIVKKKMKERQQRSSIFLVENQKDIAVQTNEEDLKSQDVWQENSEVTYATIDHTRRLSRPPVKARNKSNQFTETASVVHQPYMNFHVMY
ncbi:cell adhesion molecule CEACAM15-like isoform X1 [Chiloscyllium punctatum]|uniref:Ig-like domain-containing protein n=1 Tax=Chiloscyllium punctatum TaxID=137246 RepID=A0A401S7R6_CHIPU|nr:hypothetical protein [Chiloscyllium punctatum]